MDLNEHEKAEDGILKGQKKVVGMKNIFILYIKLVYVKCIKINVKE